MWADNFRISGAVFANRKLSISSSMILELVFQLDASDLVFRIRVASVGGVVKKIQLFS